MSWAANRDTTREEDMAYCLFGIFDVNMPLIYGEGRQNPFWRLQEEIMKHSDDQTIFAWRSPTSTFSTWRGLLAKSPKEFQHCGMYARGRHKSSRPFDLTNMGLRIWLPTRRVTENLPNGSGQTAPRQTAKQEDASISYYMTLLDCYEDSYSSTPRICLLLMRIGEKEYVRVDLTNFYPRGKSLEFHESVTDSDMTELLVKQRSDIYSYANIGKCSRIAGFLFQDVPDFVTVNPITIGICATVDFDRKRVCFSQRSIMEGEVQIARVILKDSRGQHNDWMSELTLTFDPKEAHPDCISAQFRYGQGHTRALHRTFYCTQDYVCLIDDEAYLVLNIGYRENMLGLRRHDLARQTWCEIWRCLLCLHGHLV